MVTNEIMTDRESLKRVVQDAVDQNKFHDTIYPDELAVVADVEDGDMVIVEGETSKKLSITATNFLTLAFHESEWVREALREYEPDVLEKFETESEASVSDLRDYGFYLGYEINPTTTIKGFTAIAAKIEKNQDRLHAERYYEQLYKKLTQASPDKLNVAPLPFSGSITAKNYPVRIVDPDEEDGPEIEVQSAADW